MRSAALGGVKEEAAGKDPGKRLGMLRPGSGREPGTAALQHAAPRAQPGGKRSGSDPGPAAPRPCRTPGPAGRAAALPHALGAFQPARGPGGIFSLADTARSDLTELLRSTKTISPGQITALYV